MISFNKALQYILESTETLGANKVPLPDCVGRILAEDVVARIDLPSFDKSVMDGYALRARDIRKAPATLICTGVIQAGQLSRRAVKPGRCVKIMTGAPVPKGADTVVKVEDTVQGDRGGVIIKKSLSRGRFVYLKGSDVRKSQKIVSKGRLLSVSDLALLASVGRRHIKVIRSPRVSVLSTGNEFVFQPLAQSNRSGGGGLKRGQIYNANGPQLLTLLKTDGFDAVDLGRAPDKLSVLKAKILRGFKGDVLLISGGVSMGDFDLVPRALKELGVKEIFHKVRVKPGKPLFFGKLKNKIVLGLPGNPVSTFCAYHLFARAALRKMAGWADPAPVFQEGVCAKAYKNNTRRRHFVPVAIQRKDRTFHLKPVVCHGSADVLALSKGDGLMMVPEDTPRLKAKTKIDFLTWKSVV